MESDNAKLFVGGISRETSGDTLKEHFSQYGDVLGSVVAKDRSTNNPRGFGFVSFSDPSSADKALQDSHVILGRMVEVKKAEPRSEHQKQQQLQQQRLKQQQNSGLNEKNSNCYINSQFRTKKIFVGGLSASLTEDDFKTYFERFGRINDVVVMHDSMTNRPRGFGFVTFDSEESVDNVMQKSFHELNNRFIEVKRAVPKERFNASNNSYITKIGVGRGSPCNGSLYGTYQKNNSQHGEYPPNSPRYGMFTGYAPLLDYNGVAGFLYRTGVYGWGYPIIGYDRLGYGVSPLDPRGLWYSPMMLGARACSLSYDNASVYPTYMNGGVGIMGMVPGGHAIGGPGVDGKLNHVFSGNGHLPVNVISPQLEGLKLDVDSSGLNKSSGGASSKPKLRGLDGQLKPLPVGTSR